MTIGQGIGLLVIGIQLSFVTLWALMYFGNKFDKERQKNEDTTTRNYKTTRS